MDPAGRALSPDGDAQLRGSYSAHMAALTQRAGSRPVRQALDLGCATGTVITRLSTHSIHAAMRWRISDHKRKRNAVICY